MFKFCYMSLFCALIKDTFVHFVVLFIQTLQNFYIYDNNLMNTVLLKKQNVSVTLYTYLHAFLVSYVVLHC